eukprot:3419701-Rhodomonas_salina.3
MRVACESSLSQPSPLCSCQLPPSSLPLALAASPASACEGSKRVRGQAARAFTYEVPKVKGILVTVLRRSVLGEAPKASPRRRCRLMSTLKSQRDLGSPVRHSLKIQPDLTVHVEIELGFGELLGGGAKGI